MNNKKYLAHAASLLALVSTSAFSAGFSVSEQGATSLGRAFAGSGTIASDASINFYNPAGLTHLKRAELNAGISYIHLDTDFKDNGSTVPNLGGFGGFFGQAITGGDGGIDRDYAVVPAMYYTRPINDQFSFGLGINAPYGLVTEYDDDWTGRYFAIKSELKTINFNPSIGFKASEKLSIGFGLSAQYADLELTQIVDLGATVGAPQAADGKAKLQADDWGYGWNIGLLYQMTDSTRVGLSYRSKISHTFEGDGQLRSATNALVTDENIKGDLDIPETFLFSLLHEINDKWSVASDVMWTRWSRFEELAIESDGPLLSSVKPEEWENTFRYSLGVEYKHSPKWQFRTGVAYDETPIPSAQLRTPRVPDNDRIWVTLGATYHYSSDIIIDAGYAHLFVNDVDIDETDSNGYNLNGEFEAAADIFSLQLRWLM